MDSRELEEIAVELVQNEILKFGKFTLRSGASSPFYLDLKQLPSYPTLFHKIITKLVKAANDSANKHNKPFDRIFGTAYGGIPLATALAYELEMPLLYNRKEVKEYGTGKKLEGTYERGDRVLLIDDVMTSGGSLVEAAELLLKMGVSPIQCLVIIDRRPEHLQIPVIRGHTAGSARFYTVTSLFSFPQMLRLLMKRSSIPISFKDPYRLTADQRRTILHNPVAVKIWDTMMQKKSNLILSADETWMSALSSVINSAGPEICALKIHWDTIEDATPDGVKEIRDLATKHNFIIIEDRKFADIGQTVRNQMWCKRYPKWVDAVTSHSLFGKGTLEGLQKISARAKDEFDRDFGVFMLAQSSSAGNLITPEYTQKTVEMSKMYPDIVCGFISQERLAGLDYLYATPGIHLSKKGDDMSQTYRTPKDAVQSGSDLIIVGRGIIQATNPAEKAKEYRQVSWKAFETTLAPEPDEMDD